MASRSLGPGKLGIGALGSVALLPKAIQGAYGDTPVSWMGFLRWRV